MCTWPPSSAPLAMMMWSPSLQSWATWQQAIRKLPSPSLRDAIFFFAAAIDRDAFANDVAVADDDLRVAAGVADILRLAADDDVRIDDVIVADRHVAHDRDGIQQPRAALDARRSARRRRRGQFRRPHRFPRPSRPMRFQQCGLSSQEFSNCCQVVWRCWDCWFATQPFRIETNVMRSGGVGLGWS